MIYQQCETTRSLAHTPRRSVTVHILLARCGYTLDLCSNPVVIFVLGVAQMPGDMLGITQAFSIVVKQEQWRLCA